MNCGHAPLSTKICIKSRYSSLFLAWGRLDPSYTTRGPRCVPQLGYLELCPPRSGFFGRETEAGRR
jgi:hypothetical protein